MNRKFDEHLVAVNNLRLKKNSQELISIQIDFIHNSWKRNTELFKSLTCPSDGCPNNNTPD